MSCESFHMTFFNIFSRDILAFSTSWLFLLYMIVVEFNCLLYRLRMGDIVVRILGRNRGSYLDSHDLPNPWGKPDLKL